VDELGNDRFCGALYILIESRKHTNTKTVNQILSRAANNVLDGDVRRRLLLEMIAECPGYGVPLPPEVPAVVTPPEQHPHQQRQQPAVAAKSPKAAPVVVVVAQPQEPAPCGRLVGGHGGGGGQGGGGGIAAHRQRLAGALEAAVAGVGAAGAGRAH